MTKALLDTDILSEILKAKDHHVQARAGAYRAEHGRYTLSTITIMEVVKGLSRMARAVPVASAAVPVASAAVPVASAAVPVASAAVPAAPAAVPAAPAAVPAAPAAVPAAPAAVPAAPAAGLCF